MGFQVFLVCLVWKVVQVLRVIQEMWVFKVKRAIQAEQWEKESRAIRGFLDVLVYQDYLDSKVLPAAKETKEILDFRDLERWVLREILGFLDLMG